MRKVVTIDGLAASGKSTIAQQLAKRIGFTFFSSGQLYRLVGYAVIKAARGSNIAVELDEKYLSDVLRSQTFKVETTEDGRLKSFLNNQDVTSFLDNPEVSEMTSKASAFKEVRVKLLELQQQAFPDRNIVAEGRDMGTVVFPEADLKFFIRADARIRAERRLKQLLAGGTYTPEETKVLCEKLEIEVFERDKRDTERTLSPTVPAADAIIIDNSSQTLTEIVESMYDFVAKRSLLNS